MEQQYDDASIHQLKGEKRIRIRPASMLGSGALPGARHGFTEIYGNALDEHSTGYGDRLDITYYKDGSVSIRDYGRGVPMGWNEQEGNWNWHIIFNELYGGGKYDTMQEELHRVKVWERFNPSEYNYLFSVGLNGLGAASTQYTSEFFNVRSYRDGVCTERNFEKGMPIVNGQPFNMFSLTSKDEIKSIPEIQYQTDEPNGTFIHWKPDSDVFTEIDINRDNWLYETCKDVAYVAGIDLHFVNEETGQDVLIKAGTVSDIVKDRVGDDVNIFECSDFQHIEASNIPGYEKQDGFIWLCDCNIAFAMKENDTKTVCYHNSVKMISGMQYEAVYNAKREFFNRAIRGRGISALREEDYNNCMFVAVSTQSNYASFRNQTKDAIDDRFIFDTIYKCVLDKLTLEYEKGNKEIVSAVEKAVREAEIREQLKEARKLITTAQKVKREKEPKKFVSCDAYEHKRYDEAELWITEGDSAKGSVKNARNKNFQAIYPIRGKCLNVAKATLERILANKEIREIFALLGTGFDLNIPGEKTFNIDDLRFGKIIFATDADEDGYQIRVILFLIFYRLAPQLITDGHVFIAESPRFRILLNNGESVYARNDAHRDELQKQYRGRISSISRFKGLGEVDADILRETTVHPDTRNLIPVTCDLASDAERDLIDALFGNDKFKRRKKILTDILGNGVADLFEESALTLKSIEESDMDDGVEYETVE